MEKYKVTNTGVTKEVHADTDGTPFILIKGDYLNGFGFHDGAEFELLTQNDELILAKMKDNKEGKIRRTLNKASNMIYDLITEITAGQARLAWEYMDALFDELENHLLTDEETEADYCQCECPVMTIDEY